MGGAPSASYCQDPEPVHAFPTGWTRWSSSFPPWACGLHGWISFAIWPRTCPLNAQQAQQSQGSRAQNGQSTSRPYSLRGAANSISKGTQNAANSINQATENVANTASSLSQTTQNVQKNINTISQTPQNIKNSVRAIGRPQAPKAAAPSSRQSPIKPHANR